MPKEKNDQVCSIRLLFFLISFRRLAYNLLEVHGFHGLKFEADCAEQNAAGFLHQVFSLAWAVFSLF